MNNFHPDHLVDLQKSGLNNIVEAFKQAMQNAGIEPPAEIIADGTLHRFTVAGDRARSNNGWYVLHSDDPAAGSFGCWKRGISETWCAKTYQTMTSAEKTAYTTKIEAMKRQREKELIRIQAECRAWCTDTWAKAKDATNANPYIKRKGVNAYGLKSLKDTLLVPVKDMKEAIHGLQFIAPAGSKKFKTGTNKTGHFFKIGKSKDKTIIICEGYATGASIHQATGHAVVIAFDTGNLLPVAQSIRSKYPDMKIIVAADDDHANEDNSGLTKATEAARAVNGLLAIPAFTDKREPKDTDFNDLARLVGRDAVKACIEAATIPSPVPVGDNSEQTNQLDAAIQRLAVLSTLKYDQVRKAEAKELGVRQTTLDAMVKNARKRKDDASDLPFTEAEPWHESVDVAELLDCLTSVIQRFIVSSKEVAVACALWITMTWMIVKFDIAPYLVITSPEKRCGKTQLLSLLNKLSYRSIAASSITPSALFRSIEAWSPTLFIDEADACLKDNEELRGILNSGNSRDLAYVIRNVGDNYVPTKFNTFCPKAISGIGHISDTLEDRSIIMELRRRLPHEKVERLRYADPAMFSELRSKLARLAEDYGEDVRQKRPPLPDELNDREQDIWEPLLAIAMTAGDEWLRIGKETALKLSGNESASQTIGIELLSDIQKVFKEKKVEHIFTADLITDLCADDERPWKTYGKGFPITAKQLASKLKPYGVHSNSVRTGDDTGKGYTKEKFADAFSRYIPITPAASVTTSQPTPVEDLPAFPSVTQEDDVTDRNRRNPLIVKECDVVTDKNQKTGLLQTKEQIEFPYVGQTEDLRELTI